MASLNTDQILTLNWFYNCHKRGETASYKGSIKHFGEVMKIREPLDVIKSLLDIGFISINKVKFEVSITTEGINYYNSLKKK
jgi:hypothetical protein